MAQPGVRGALVDLAAPERRSGPSVPASVSSFIGRERQLAEVGQLLAAHRLVTLTGAGGVGKTRLALEVARRALGQGVDRVQFVSLASLSDGSLVEAEVMHALGLRERPGWPLLRSLELALRDRDLLLVLDNFEHLLDAAPWVAAWLEACPTLTVLATSRALLGLPGEQVYQVPPLTLPEAGTGPDAPEDASEAVRLFVDRAWSVQPSFRLTAAHAGAVAEICRRLDGLPLAIELAAAWVRLLTPSDIAARLDDRFRLLVGGSPTAPPRQRTLRAAIDWSHDLLSNEERILLRRLSVFAGGWALEAAEVVCGGDDLPDVLDVLSQLIDKSLVTVDDVDGSRRYRLLDVIRQYSAERLAEAGETSILRRRHAEWTLGLAERAEPEFWGPDQTAWLERLDVEHDNVRAALAWSQETGDVEPGLRLGSLLLRFWEQRGHAGEARTWFSALLDRPSPAPSSARAMALLTDAYLAHTLGDLSGAEPRAEEALALARVGGDQVALAYALIVQGLMGADRGDVDVAEAHFEEALALAREGGLETCVRIALVDLGEVARFRGALDQAAALLEEVRAKAEAAGDGYTHLYSLMALAHLAHQRGEWDTAASRAREALAILRDLHDLHTTAMLIEVIAWPVSAQGLPQQAARLLGAAEALRRLVGAVILPVLQADHERALATVQAALGERAFAAAWAEGRAMPLPRAVAYALEASGTPAPLDGATEACSGDRTSVTLTQRERDILLMIGRAYANRTIAEELAVSRRTVEWHVSKLLGRFGLQSRAQLARWVLDQGILRDK